MSDNEHTTVRIVDIARMAGVSVATVDRVIHNRGKVSEENLARINEVLRRVDYRPNLIARSLASGRRYTLCAVMPRFAPFYHRRRARFPCRPGKRSFFLRRTPSSFYQVKTAAVGRHHPRRIY